MADPANRSLSLSISAVDSRVGAHRFMGAGASKLPSAASCDATASVKHFHAQNLSSVILFTCQRLEAAIASTQGE